MTMVSVSELVTEAREIRRRDVVACAAAADYIRDFERLDRLARYLRDHDWPEGAGYVQDQAERAYRASRAELRPIEEIDE